MNNYYQKPNFNHYPVVKNLLIANIAMYVLTYVLHSMQNIDLNDILGLHYFEASGFQPHQLITHLFLHSQVWESGGTLLHIVFNMYGLWMFGQIMENHWGSKKFFTYYMICGIGAGITQEAAWYYTIHHTAGIDLLSHAQYLAAVEPITAIGASGAIFGLLLAFGMTFPNVPLYIMFIPVPIKAKYLVIGYGLYELFGGVSNRAGDNVAHYAHIGGLIFGFILIMIWRARDKKY